MGKLDKTMNTNIHSSQSGRVRTDRHTAQVPDQAGRRADGRGARVYLRTDKDGGGEGRIARMAAGLPAPRAPRPPRRVVPALAALSHACRRYIRTPLAAAAAAFM